MKYCKVKYKGKVIFAYLESGSVFAYTKYGERINDYDSRNLWNRYLKENKFEVSLDKLSNIIYELITFGIERNALTISGAIAIYENLENDNEED